MKIPIKRRSNWGRKAKFKKPDRGWLKWRARKAGNRRQLRKWFKQ